MRVRSRRVKRHCVCCLCAQAFRGHRLRSPSTTSSANSCANSIWAGASSWWECSTKATTTGQTLSSSTRTSETWRSSADLAGSSYESRPKTVHPTSFGGWDLPEPRECESAAIAPRVSSQQVHTGGQSMRGGNRRPEPALVFVVERRERVRFWRLQRHPRAAGSAQRGPVWRAVGVRGARRDERRPVVDHLVGQLLLRRIQRLPAADVEQVAHFHGMSGADGKRNLLELLGRRRIAIVELVCEDWRAVRYGHFYCVCGTGEYL